MIEFKKNVAEILPYKREQYIDFLDDDINLQSDWYGVSLQLNCEGDKIDALRAIEVFEPIFEYIISNLDNGSCWIINHDDKDLNWFPNDGDNLKSLRNLFKQNNIQNIYKGSLVLEKDDLYRLAKDLISYSYILSYKNLDISHGELQFIIKITSHLTFDILSTDKMLLRKILNENSSNSYDIIQYRGSSLWS